MSFLTNGVDISTLFNTGSSSTTSNYKTGNTDIKSVYRAYASTTYFKCPLTNYLVNGTDLHP